MYPAPEPSGATDRRYQRQLIVLQRMKACIYEAKEVQLDRLAQEDEVAAVDASPPPPSAGTPLWLAEWLRLSEAERKLLAIATTVEISEVLEASARAHRQLFPEPHRRTRTG